LRRESLSPEVRGSGKSRGDLEVDVIIPLTEVEVLVKEGDAVMAGETILARTVSQGGN